MQPDFIVIGAMKCGSSTVCAYLEDHPDIFMVPRAEPKFFSHDENFARGTDWYESLFAGQDGAGARAVIVRTECCEASGVHVSVADTGCGLPRGAEDQVFEPLFTTKASGMGMGLPIARAIIEAHGGTLAAYNGTGRGSTFRFTLPAAHEHVWS